MLVSYPSVGLPNIYDTAPSKNVLVSCSKVKPLAAPPLVLLHWKANAANLDNVFFMQTVQNKKAHRCTICYSKSKADCITSCGHVFCRCCCIRSVQTTGGKCPVCKQEVDEKKQIFSIETREETVEESITRTYGQLAFQNYFLAVSNKASTLFFMRSQHDAETLNVLLKGVSDKHDILVVHTTKSKQALRCKSYGMFKMIVYNSETRMCDEYLQMVASSLGAQENFNIHF